MNTFEINQQKFTKDHGVITMFQRGDHKDPRWYVKVKITGSTGYVKKSTGTQDEFEARQFAETLYESLVDKFKTTGSTATRTFKSVVDEWLSQLTKRPEVVEEFRTRLYAYPVRLWGSTYIDRLTDADLVEFLSWRKSNSRNGKKPSPATIKRDLVPLKQVFEYAYGKRYITRPLKFQTIQAKSNRRPEFTENEWRSILQSLDKWVAKSKGHPRSYRDRVYLKYYILIVGNTGMRPGSETRALTWSCIDFQRFQHLEHEQLVIRVPKGKQGSRWVVPDRVVRGYLDQLRQFRTEELEKADKPFRHDEPIFCHEDGKPIHTFKKGFKAFLTHFGLLKDIDGVERVPYSLRHTYATRHIRAGHNHWDLAKNMGTSVEELESTYVHDDHTQYGKGFLDGAPTPGPTLDAWFEID